MNNTGAQRCLREFVLRGRSALTSFTLTFDTGPSSARLSTKGDAIRVRSELIGADTLL